ncbi:hypothetical protein BWZ20_05240 [Winogradskyella sp. J14-2]|uniref:DUF7672 family protein n=1 Tax=Winogradskyella sp. J14-2 TaxID=1936080 RepID=UPI000972CC0A|nr:hypothetical protein [Winogradskyella sp. J14-2]APY07735.1 hypothetical protein BWZ20_05240 [Winogradskyella sp. J14-2]
MFRIYIIGIAILVIAILANGIVLKLGIKSWYDFIGLISNDGFSAFKSLTFIDVLWLFLGYPMVLGFGYWLGDKLYNFIF